MDSALFKTAIELLQQAVDLVDNTLETSHLVFESKVMPGSTIGKHLRHLADHFHLLYEQSASARLNYDKRDRNTAVENNLDAARARLVELQERTKQSMNSNTRLEQHLVLSATIDPKDNQTYQFNSSFGRELFYCCIHAIHHYASIKAICIELGLNVPSDFGVAPSTLDQS
ncbi:hypothetical protein BY458DRAFT_521370 [Sporodiniella umbellata]|nr:hypothetical protein BY458DRAFT_521370 [Sporodiniella umbellata]